MSTVWKRPQPNKPLSNPRGCATTPYTTFDNSSTPKALEALLKPPAIPGLTDSLTDLSPTDWRTTLARLRQARLLAGADPHQPGHLDAHPLVREYFGDQLRRQRAEAWREGNRRLYEHYRALAPPLPENVRDMEPLFMAVVCGCRAGFYRDALHEVYLPRIQRGNTSFAANTLGARGALLSVLAYFFESDRWGSPVQAGVEGQRLNPEDQLLILMQAAVYLTATRGLAAPEARICYERAEPLCQSLGRPLLLGAALIGQWRYSLHTDKLTATLRIAERVHSLAQAQHDAGLLMEAYRALAATLFSLGDFEASRQYAMRAVQIWRSGNVPSYTQDPYTPVVACLCYLTLAEWHLGEIASGQATIAEAISLAKGLNGLPALAIALAWAAAFAQCQRNPAEVDRLATELIELSTRYHFAFWLPEGAIYRGWARSVSGDPAAGILWIEQGIRDLRATGTVLALPYFLGLRAEAFHLANRTSEALEAIKEAEEVVERSEEREWCAELHRLRGVLLAATGADKAQIEAAFGEAIRTAKQQKSISLMKRAEASHAEYRGQKRKR